jgi:hypothetical protein
MLCVPEGVDSYSITAEGGASDQSVSTSFTCDQDGFVITTHGLPT